MEENNYNNDTETTRPEKDEEFSSNHRFTANKKYFTISIYVVFVVIASLLVYKILGDLNITGQTISYVIGILSPFIIGAFIAFLLSPLCRWANETVFKNWIKIKNAKARKYISITCTYIVAIGFLTIISIYIAPQIYESITEVTRKMPDWYKKIEASVMDFISQHPEWNIDSQQVNSWLNEALPKIIDYSTNLIESIVPAVFTTFTAIFKGILNLFIAFMVSIYMLSSHKELLYSTKRLLYASIPEKKANHAIRVCKESIKIFGGFLFGKAIDSLIIGILCFIFMLIFRFPYPVLISVIVGITNMIPYFGPFIGGGIGGLIILIVDPIQVIFFALLILALQQFDGLYLGPKILGDTTGLRPLWVIFSITIGGSLFGVLGMFLGVPCVAVIRYLMNNFISSRLTRKKIVLNPPDKNSF